MNDPNLDVFLEIEKQEIGDMILMFKGTLETGKSKENVSLESADMELDDGHFLIYIGEGFYISKLGRVRGFFISKLDNFRAVYPDFNKTMLFKYRNLDNKG